MATVLVVDDEEPVREVIREMLSGAGHRVLEAQDGDEGLRLCRTFQPDAVVTDILMPKKGGIVLISELVKERPGIRILAISGGGRDGRLNFLSTARTFPGVRTVRKPFDRSEFLRAVADLLAGL